MPKVQVRDVPEEVHQALVRQAELVGQSLQQYLRCETRTDCDHPKTIDEILDRIEHRSKGLLSSEDAIAALDSEPARR